MKKFGVRNPLASHGDHGDGERCFPIWQENARPEISVRNWIARVKIGFDRLIFRTAIWMAICGVLAIFQAVSEAQQLPTEGMNPGGQLVGSGVSWERLNQADTNANQDSPVPVQVGDEGGVIFTQPGLRNRGPFSPIPQMPWTTGDTSPDSSLQGRPFETSMGPRVIGGYTVLPTLPGVSRVNSAFGGIPSPGHERQPVSEGKKRFDRYQAELDAQRAAEREAAWNQDQVSGSTSRRAPIRALTSALPIYAETRVPNLNQAYRPAPIPQSVFGGEMGNPEPRGIVSSTGRIRPSRVVSNAESTAANGPVWMRDARSNAEIAPDTAGNDTANDMSDAPANGGGMEEDSMDMSADSGQGGPEFANESNPPAEAFYQPLASDETLYSGDPASSIAQKIFNASAVRRTTPMHVFVQGNTVVLQGSVRSLYDRDLAEAIAASEPGIRRVKNQLRVQD